MTGNGQHLQRERLKCGRSTRERLKCGRSTEIPFKKCEECIENEVIDEYHEFSGN